MWPINQIKTFARKMRVKQNPVLRSMMMMLSGSPAWTKTDLAKLTKAGYQNCYAVYACVKQIVDAAGGIPWVLFKRPMSQGGKREKLDEHALLNLMRRPNPQDGGAAFVKNELAFYLIVGNSYIIKVGPERGEPRELYYMRPDRVHVLPGTRFEPIRGYRYTVDGVPRKPDFKPNEVLHLKAFHPLDDWYGLSPIEVAAKQVDIQAMAAEWNARLLQNDCRPPGAIVTEGNLEEEQHKRLEEQLEAKMTGYKHAGRPPVFEAGIKWQSFAITPRDMDWLNSDKLNSRKICAVYNVAPELIGDAENKTYSNYQEARKALYMETVLPLMDYLRDEYNNWLTPAFLEERLWLDYDKDAIEAIREELNAVYERQEKAWWRSINEKRLACGDDEIGKEGDVIMVPANLIPLADISGGAQEE
jgi:HK97 family phage portal protein